MVPSCAEWRRETENRATTSFSYCSSTASLLVSPHCANVRWIRCPWRTGGDHRDATVLRRWRLSSRTWNHLTSPWMKQLTWLRIVHSGEWCLRLALCTHSGAWQKWMKESYGCRRRVSLHVDTGVRKSAEQLPMSHTTSTTWRHVPRDLARDPARWSGFSETRRTGPRNIGWTAGNPPPHSSSRTYRTYFILESRVLLLLKGH